MILTDGNISQSKIVETSKFLFEPINIEKYYFRYNNQTISFKK